MKQESGFTLFEVLIICIIIVILSIFIIPAYFTYMEKLKFAEVIQATFPYKLAVEECYKSQGGGSVVSGCNNGSNNVPKATYDLGNVASIVTSDAGVITAKGRDKAPADTYILTPAPSDQTLSWTTSGTCVISGTC